MKCCQPKFVFRACINCGGSNDDDGGGCDSGGMVNVSSKIQNAVQDEIHDEHKQ